jgi:hypothetical protein
MKLLPFSHLATSRTWIIGVPHPKVPALISSATIGQNNVDPVKFENRVPHGTPKYSGFDLKWIVG